MSGGAALRPPVGGVTLYATPSAAHRSRVFFGLPDREAISQGGYTLVNLRADIEFGE